MLAAAAVDLRKFCWVGKNKHFNEIMVSPPMTTEDLLTGNYLSFFAMSNREKGGNCEFIMEIFEGDNLIYYGTNMSGLTAKIENGKFVGEYHLLPPIRSLFQCNGFCQYGTGC